VQEAQLKSGMSPLADEFGVAAPDTYGKLGRDGALTTVTTEPGRYRDFYVRLAVALQGNGPLPVDARDVLEPIRILETLHSQRTA
jgi:hypothetical protein